MTLDQNINRAADELPEEWVLYVSVSLGLIEVMLFNPNGRQVLLPDQGDLNDRISEAVSYAKEKA